MSLLVAGALHWDVILRAPRLPREDETLRGTGVRYQFGGKGGNQAVAAAAEGATVSFAGRVGADDAGRAMRAVLEAAGVDVTQLQTGPGASGMSAAIVKDDGGYGAVIVSGENHAFDAAAVQMPEGCRMVLLQNEMAAGVTAAMANKARDAGADVLLNAAPATGLEKADLVAVDTLVVNRIEGADLLDVAEDGLDPEACAKGLQALAPQARIILTLGGEGVVFAEPGGAVRKQPASKVAVQSTHGAGDVFVGSYAAAILAGCTLPQAILSGQRAAAAHISQIR